MTLFPPQEIQHIIDNEVSSEFVEYRFIVDDSGRYGYGRERPSISFDRLLLQFLALAGIGCAVYLLLPESSNDKTSLINKIETKTSYRISDVIGLLFTLGWMGIIFVMSIIEGPPSDPASWATIAGITLVIYGVGYGLGLVTRWILGEG